VSDIETEEIERVRCLLIGSAPEREQELLDLWNKYQVNVAAVDDKPGFEMGGGAFQSVLFTPRTLRQVWLLGFAGWRACEAYAGVLWVMASFGLPYNPTELTKVQGQTAAELEFERALTQARGLREAYTESAFSWPRDIPTPDQLLDSATDEVTRDITCLALAFVFLHELHHVMLAQKNLLAHEEEAACDEFASRFLLDRADEYARTNGKAVEKVRVLRAMGICLGLFVVTEVTARNARSGSQSHPDVADRWLAFLGQVDVPSEHWFWAFTGSLLIAALRVEGKDRAHAAVGSCRGLCLEIVRDL